MKYLLTMPGTTEVAVGHVADAIASKTSGEQAIILYEIFQAIKYNYKSVSTFENKLLHIAGEIRKKDLDDLKYVIEILNAFLQEEME